MNKEENLENIWNKWTKISIPEEKIQQCAMYTKPVEKTLTILYKKCLDHGLLSNFQPSVAGGLVGTALGKLSRGSFMVGLEFPEYKNQEDDFSTTKSYRILLEATLDATGVLILYLSELRRIGVLSEGESKIIFDDTVQKIKNAMLSCFSLGTKHL